MDDPALAHLRRRVDGVDRALVHLLAERHHLVLALAEIKEQHDLDVHQPDREAEMSEVRSAWAQAEGLEPGFVVGLFQDIWAEARRVQRERRG